MSSRNIHKTVNAKETIAGLAPLFLSLVAIAAKLGAAGLGFALSIFLARTVPLSEFGAFAFGLSVASTVSVFASLGLPFATVRFLPGFLARGETGKAHVFEALVVRFSLLGGIASVVILASVAWARGLDTQTGWALLAAAPLAFVLTLIVSLSALMQGRQRAIQGEIGGNFLRSLISLALVVAIYLASHELLDGGSALLAVALSGIASSVVLGVMLLRARSGDGPVVAVKLAAQERATWIRTGFAVLLILSGSVLNERLDVLMLTILSGLENAGLYSAAARISLVLTLGFAGLSAHLAPKLAAAWGEGKRAETVDVLRQAAQIGAVAIGILAIALFALTKPLLVLFGTEYLAAAPTLHVLLSAQWFVAAFGLTGALVVLSGNEKVALLATVAGLVANITLNIFLVPKFGAIGAAYATLIGLGCVQISLSFWCWRVLGLKPDFFSRLFSKQHDMK